MIMNTKLLLLLVFISTNASAQINWDSCFNNSDKLKKNDLHLEFLKIDTNKCIHYSYNSDGSVKEKTLHVETKDAATGEKTVQEQTVVAGDPKFLFLAFEENFSKISQIPALPPFDFMEKGEEFLDEWDQELRNQTTIQATRPVDYELKNLIRETLDKETHLKQCNPILFQELGELIENDKIHIINNPIVDAPGDTFYYDRWGTFGDRIILKSRVFTSQDRGKSLWGLTGTLKVSNFVTSLIQAYIMNLIQQDPDYHSKIQHIHPSIIHHVLKDEQATKKLKKELEDIHLDPYELALMTAIKTFVVDNIPCVSN